MIDILKFEKECFLGDIDKFIFYSNNKVIRQVINRMTYPRTQSQAILDHSEIQNYKNRLLYQIFDILLKEPEADYFWFGKDGNLVYSLPHHQVVDANSIRVNRPMVKSFIRETKINHILF
jgi:hypothetical protein